MGSSGKLPSLLRVTGSVDGNRQVPDWLASSSTEITMMWTVEAHASLQKVADSRNNVDAGTGQVAG